MTIGSGSLSSSLPITWTVAEKTKHSYYCSCKINTEFGRSWSSNNTHGLGLYSSRTTATSTRAISSKRNPYSWVQRRKNVFKDFLFSREYGNDGDGDGDGDVGGGGDGDGGDDNRNDDCNDDADDNAREEEFAIPVIKFEEIIKEIESRGAYAASVFTSHVLEVLQKEGIRINVLSRYLDLQEKGWLLAFLTRHCSFIRNRMLADPDFLVKLTTELAIYSFGTTVGELHKRGKDFWDEFELYAADLFVGLLVKSVVFSLYAPIISIGQSNFPGNMLQPISTLTSQFWRSKYIFMDPLYILPNVMIYGAVGYVCSLIGQGIANEIMTAKRKMKKSNGDVSVPPLMKTAKTWGLYSGFDLSMRDIYMVGIFGKFIGWLNFGKSGAILAQAFYISVQFASSFKGASELLDLPKKCGIE